MALHLLRQSEGRRNILECITYIFKTENKGLIMDRNKVKLTFSYLWKVNLGDYIPCYYFNRS